MPDPIERLRQLAEPHSEAHNGFKREVSSEDQLALKSLLEELISLRAATQTKGWGDKGDKWTTSIREAHPTKTRRFGLYDQALEMVGNRHSKYALVDLVNWLLAEKEKVRG